MSISLKRLLIEPTNIWLSKHSTSCVKQCSQGLFSQGSRLLWASAKGSHQWVLEQRQHGSDAQGQKMTTLGCWSPWVPGQLEQGHWGGPPSSAQAIECPGSCSAGSECCMESAAGERRMPTLGCSGPWVPGQLQHREGVVHWEGGGPPWAGRTLWRLPTVLLSCLSFTSWQWQ